MNIIFLLVFVIVIIFEIVTKKKFPEGQINNDPLTLNEKILIWFLCIFNPVLAGAVLYYGWRKRIPVKAKQANKISLLAFFLELIIAIILYSLGIIKL